jgi:hypothetical protein
MLDHAEENRSTTVVILLVIVVALGAAFYGLSKRSSSGENCMATGDELIERGGRRALSEAEYLKYRQQIEKACSKKVAQEILAKAER